MTHMRILIAERLRPFSHLPGTRCVLPGSPYQIEVYPARIFVHDLSARDPKCVAEIVLSIEGPVGNFTVQQDLETGAVRVFGQASNGYFRYGLKAASSSEGIYFLLEKPGLKWKCLSSFPMMTMTQESNSTSVYHPPKTDRLSLGSHKSQDWEMVKRRNNLEEVFPEWLRLGQLVPSLPLNHRSGTSLWLNECEKAIDSQPPELILRPFLNLFQTGFEGILSPRLIDSQYLGLELPSIPHNTEGSPLAILSEGALLIRRLFIEQNGNRIALLPRLPPQFHCGRLLNVRCGEEGFIDLEWSKKVLRRAIFTASSDARIQFDFQKDLRSYRLRTSTKDSGIQCFCPSSLEIKQGTVYFLDNFRK